MHYLVNFCDSFCLVSFLKRKQGSWRSREWRKEKKRTTINLMKKAISFYKKIKQYGKFILENGKKGTKNP